MVLASDELVRKALTQTSNLTAAIPQLWAKQIEKNLRKHAVLQQSILENTDLLVPGAGNTVYVPLLPDMGQVDALTEGTDMTPYALTNASSVALTPSEYGMTIAITRKAIDRFGYDSVAEIMDRLAYSMTLRIENTIAKLYNANVPGTSGNGLANGQLTTLYPNGHTTANIVAADTMNDSMIWAGMAALQTLNNVPFPDGYYRLYMNPNTWAELIQDTNIRQDMRWAAPDTLLNGHVADIHGCHIIVTNFIQTSAEGSGGAVTVNNSLLVAPRWAVGAWKRRPGAVIDPTLYDMGRRRNFGITADFDIELLHNERAVVLKSV